MNWNGFRGSADRLDDLDIPHIASRIMVGEDELHAFMDVEANGSGFDAAGRPKMLFEPHVFFRNLDGEKRSRAVMRGLAYSKWGMKPYPKDSYQRLLAAMEIDETAALKSASWGLGQILGENHKAAGFDSPQEMVLEFMDDEATHLSAMVNFLIANRLDDELRRHDWVGLARGYNGPGYAKHNYHGRLAAAFKRWQGIRDTPVGTPPPVSIEEADTFPVLRYGDGYWRNVKLATYVKIAQGHLKRWGLYDEEIDGKFGAETEQAVRIFQQTHGLTVDGVIGPEETWPKLVSDAIYPTEEPEETTEPVPAARPEETQPRGSRKGVGGEDTLKGVGGADKL